MGHQTKKKGDTTTGDRMLPRNHVWFIARNSAVNSSMASRVSIKCRKPSFSLRLAARELAVLVAFLICRPLIFRSARDCSISSLKVSPPIWTPTFVRKARHTWTLASLDSSWKCKATWIRERNASSNVLTRLVVRKRIPR